MCITQDSTDAPKRWRERATVHGLARSSNGKHAALFARPWQSIVCPNLLFVSKTASK